LNTAFHKVQPGRGKGENPPPDVKKPAVRFFYGLWGVVMFTIVWYLIGHLIFNRPEYEQFDGFLPGPTLKALSGLVQEGNFWRSVLASLRRIFAGILISFVVGLPFGLLIGFYRKLQLITYTPIQFLRMISPVSWMPVALLLFKQFESAIYFLITMATVWPILLNTAQGVTSVNPHWINMARNQGATDFQLLTRVIIPATLPYILAGLRLALGVAWIVLVPAEFFGISSGLGYLINDARDTLEYDRLMAILIAIGIVGFILDWALQYVERLFSWTAKG
jgi:NitT/TauT family transport system permease protein